MGFALIFAMLVGQDTSAQAIITQAMANNAFGFANARATLTLALERPGGVVRARQVNIRSAELDGARRTLVRFLMPADVAGCGLLIREGAAGHEDEQYLYLPALGKTKRITGRQQNEKFMGTDLTYGDIQGGAPACGDLARQADTTLSGQPVHVVVAQARDPAKCAYGKVVSYVHRQAMLAVRIEFFGHDGALAKTLTVTKLRKEDGHWVAADSTIEDMQSHHRTSVHLDSIAFGNAMTAADFRLQALAAP